MTRQIKTGVSIIGSDTWRNTHQNVNLLKTKTVWSKYSEHILSKTLQIHFINESIIIVSPLPTPFNDMCSAWHFSEYILYLNFEFLFYCHLCLNKEHNFIKYFLNYFCSNLPLPFSIKLCTLIFFPLLVTYKISILSYNLCKLEIIIFFFFY